jgi:hypothetical protein
MTMLAATCPHVKQPTREQALGKARAQMRRQIAGLERQLSQADLDCARFAVTPDRRVRNAGPRLVDLRELECQRDELIRAIAHARLAAGRVQSQYAAARRELYAMLADPRSFKFARIRNEQLGLPSCKTYEVRPRLGLIGMLAGWWHVTISSGCP